MEMRAREVSAQPAAREVRACPAPGVVGAAAGPTQVWTSYFINESFYRKAVTLGGTVWHLLN